MFSRKVTALTLASGLALLPTATSAGAADGGTASDQRPASAAECGGVIQVHGSVAASTSVTSTDLQGYPTATVTGFNGQPVTGVPLEYLLYSIPNPTDPTVPATGTTGTESVVGPTPAGPVSYSTGAKPDAATLVLPNQAKNGFLAAVLTVTGIDRNPLAVAVGELDANFGNHPGLLVGIGSGRPSLVFPQDRDSSRTVPGVYDVRVTVVDPATLDVPPVEVAPTVVGNPPPANTSVVVRKNRGETVEDLWLSQLQALPQVTLTVGTKTDTGPTLGSVLDKLDFHPRRDTAVWATGSPFAPPPTGAGSGNYTYSTAVTPAEAGPGARPVLIAVNETPVGSSGASTPRLVPVGDVKGGRLNSNFVTLTILDTGTDAMPEPRGCR
jgi:hypothetical protein